MTFNHERSIRVRSYTLRHSLLSASTNTCSLLFSFIEWGHFIVRLVSSYSIPFISMFSLNRVQLIGYLTQPVDLRQTPGGQSVADLNVAVPYSFKAESGQELSGQSFHSVTAWGGMAEVAAQYAKPGSQLFLSGRLQTDSWKDEKSGEKRSKTRMEFHNVVL